MRVFAFLILAGVLAGLGGCRQQKPLTASRDEAQNAPQPDPPPAPGPDHRPLLVCFGDSLTAGFGADAGSSYPDFLQKDLDAAGFHYHVINEGVSGITTKDGLERLQGIVAMKPAVVVVEFGGNDGLRGLNVDTTKQNLAKIIAALKASGARVLIAGISLPPDYGGDYVGRFTANYAALGKEFGVPLLPFLLQDVYGVEGMMQPDRTHATDKGNEVVARNVAQALLPLLRR